jgi:hypothetical protein
MSGETGLTEPPGVPGGGGRRGLSPTGWAAVTALGAAGITAAATLVTHFLPPSTPQAAVGASSVLGSPSASGQGALVTPAPSPVPAPRSALIDRLTGTWSGPARDGSQQLTMTLVVTADCAEGRRCGTLTTDLLPCVADITLVGISDGPQFDFATGSYSPDSSPSCELRHGGDYFILGDDVLAYRTGYDGGRSGTLRRVGQSS